MTTTPGADGVFLSVTCSIHMSGQVIVTAYFQENFIYCRTLGGFPYVSIFQVGEMI